MPVLTVSSAAKAKNGIASKVAMVVARALFFMGALGSDYFAELYQIGEV